MTPDELRALADALEPMAKAPRFEDFDVPAFCAWVRAQADVQPVPAVPAIEERGPWSADREGRHIWIESNDFTHDGRLYVNGDFESNDQRFAYAQEIARRLNAAPTAPAGWKLVPVEPTGLMVDAGREAMQRAPDLGGIVSANTAEVMDSYTAMLAAAPAAPQAEPVSDPRPCTCHPDDSPPVPCARKYALSECRAASGEPTEAQIEAATVALYSYFGDEQSRLFLKSVADDVLRSALAAKDE